MARSDLPKQNGVNGAVRAVPELPFMASLHPKENIMASSSNDKSGSQSGKQQSGSQQSDKQSGSRQSSGGTQGGTHEQHVEAGRQSHKNDGDKQSGQSGSQGSQQSGQQSGQSRSGGSEQSGSGAGSRGGTHEQHVEAGRQSHKNDDKS